MISSPSGNGSKGIVGIPLLHFLLFNGESVASFRQYTKGFTKKVHDPYTVVNTQEHIAQLEKEITTIVEQSREGQIVQSLGIGPIQTATILAAIGSIKNFPNAGSLKSYCGWSPTVVQSGTTLNSTVQTRGGTRPIKQMMFLIVSGLINRDTEWARLYERLVQAKCPLDPRTGQRTGKLSHHRSSRWPDH